jgi:hypothetical protein
MILLIAAIALAAPGKSAIPAAAANDPRLAGAYRFERGGWTYVHLEGGPAQIGFQHGYLLAPEIADALAAYKLDATHTTKRDWNFFRETSEKVLWPHIEKEYREELQGIVDGSRTAYSSISMTSSPSTPSKRCRTIMCLGST